MERLLAIGIVPLGRIVLVVVLFMFDGVSRAQPMPMNSPKPIRHGLDHLVIAVRNLDAAKAAYEKLGFVVTTESTHPFGTSNRLVVFDTNFLELLAITDPDAKEQTPSVQFIQSLLRMREGAFSLSLTSLNIQEDYVALKQHGAEPFEPEWFERHATLPDGSQGTVKAGFTGWFPEQVSLARLFYSQQARPQYIWAPGWQQHVNGAKSLRSATIVVEKPLEYKHYLESMILSGSVKSNQGRLLATTPSGSIEVISPDDYLKRYTRANVKLVGQLPCIAAIKIAVSSPEVTRSYLRSKGIPFVVGKSGALIVLSDQTSGLLIEFVR